MQLFLFLLPMLSTAYAADPNKPHPHQGISEKFGKPTKTPLTASETAKIKSGEAILKQVKKGNGGRGIAVMDIDASQEVLECIKLHLHASDHYVHQRH